MPRDHTRVNIDIWGDDEWLDLLNGANSLRGIGRLWMLAHMPRIAYSGPIGGRADWRRLPHRVEGIYHLFDADGQFLYIGKTCNPLSRFIRHKEKKDWWAEVSTLNFYVPQCHDHDEDPCPPKTLLKAAFRWEAAAIRRIQPLGNVMGVAA